MSPVDRRDAPLLQVRDLTVHFALTRGLRGRSEGPLRAVDGVSFDVRSGETLGLVGESGCGKSTTGRAILGLLRPTAGRVRFDGRDVTTMDQRGLRELRRRAQIVFQDPYGSLNPRMSARAMLGEALRVHGVPAGRRLERSVELLERVGMRPDHLDRYPHEFSGGQRQRLGIARALSVEPDLLILDEPVSALDLSVQAQVINLLKDLQDAMGLAYLFIAHDLALVEHVSDRVAVMYLGKIVELGDAADLFSEPRHPYTRALLSAVPSASPRKSGERRVAILPGDVPDPARPPSGCAFHTRCPHPLKDASCTGSVPVLEAKRPGHFAACAKESGAALHGA